MEPAEMPEIALGYYAQVLEADSSNVAPHIGLARA